VVSIESMPVKFPLISTYAEFFKEGLFFKGKKLIRLEVHLGWRVGGFQKMDIL